MLGMLAGLIVLSDSIFLFRSTTLYVPLIPNNLLEKVSRVKRDVRLDARSKPSNAYG